MRVPTTIHPGPRSTTLGEVKNHGRVSPGLDELRRPIMRVFKPNRTTVRSEDAARRTPEDERREHGDKGAGSAKA